jgi:hypothetical protein
MLLIADIRPENPDSNTEAVAGGACRCKAGYSGQGTGPRLVCTGEDATML